MNKTQIVLISQVVVLPPATQGVVMHIGATLVLVVAVVPNCSATSIVL